MLATRPIGSPAFTAPVESGGAGSAADSEATMHAETEANVAADPVAKFVANNGAHASMPPSNAPVGGRSGGNGSHDAPVLETKKEVRAATNNNTAKTCTPIPPKSYDVANTSQQEIDALKNATCGTKDELDKMHRLGVTIENAKAAYADLLSAKPPAKIFVTTSAGNGGQPVMTVVGPKFDPSKPKVVQTHYHGDNATVADPLGSKAGQNARIREVILNENPQTVFVLPEAQNTTPSVDSPQNDKSQPGVSWGNVSNEVQTTDDALAAAGLKLDRQNDKTVVSMHSGGGMALVHLMNADPKGNNLKADRLELFDCVYHFRSGDPKNPIVSENFIRNWGKTANGQACEQVIFYRAGNRDPQHIAKVIGEGFPPRNGKDRFRMFDMANEPKLVGKDGAIDNKLNPEAKDSNGNTFPQNIVTHDSHGKKVVTQTAHNFNLDSHYRTVGQFLGSTAKVW